MPNTTNFYHNILNSNFDTILRIILNIATHLKEKDINDNFFYDELDLLISLVSDSRRLTDLYCIADSIEGGSNGCKGSEIYNL